MKRNSVESVSEFVDAAVVVLKKKIGQGEDIADLISIVLDRFPKIQLAEACHTTGERPHSARIAKFLLQHPNITSIKFGLNKTDKRLFFFTEVSAPYANSPESETYIPEGER